MNWLRVSLDSGCGMGIQRFLPLTTRRRRNLGTGGVGGVE
jgi:hypothetical protein